MLLFFLSFPFLLFLFLSFLYLSALNASKEEKENSKPRIDAPRRHFRVLGKMHHKRSQANRKRVAKAQQARGKKLLSLDFIQREIEKEFWSFPYNTAYFLHTSCDCLWPLTNHILDACDACVASPRPFFPGVSSCDPLRPLVATLLRLLATILKLDIYSVSGSVQRILKVKKK